MTAVFLLGVLVLAGTAMFSGAGARKIRADTYAITPETVTYQASYFTSGTVMPSDTSILEVPGTAKKWLVRVGEKVENGAGLCVYTEDGTDSTMKSTQAGIVTEIGEQSVKIGNTKKLTVSFGVPAEIRKTLSEGTPVKAGGEPAKISFVSAIAADDGANYPVEALLSSGASVSVGETVRIEVPKGEEQQVWKVPEECVLSAKGKQYVFYPSWLEHITDLERRDFAVIQPLHYEDGYYYAEPENGVAILKLSELASSYLQELILRL